MSLLEASPTKSRLSPDDTKAKTSKRELNGSPETWQGRKRQKSLSECSPRKRNLEDLWRAAFPVGPEWVSMDKIHEFKWNFSNLEQALEEGGDLYGETVYLCGCIEPMVWEEDGEDKTIHVPVIVAMICAVTPCDKVIATSFQRQTREVISMEALKLAWYPYIPLDGGLGQAEKMKTQIYTIHCEQKRFSLNTEHIKQYDCCIPFVEPKHDYVPEDTVVDLLFPAEQPITMNFNWQEVSVGRLAAKLIRERKLRKDQKDAFVNYVDARIHEKILSEEEKRMSRLDRVEFHKFYPVQTADIPFRISNRATVMLEGYIPLVACTWW